MVSVHYLVVSDFVRVDFSCLVFACGLLWFVLLSLGFGVAGCCVGLCCWCFVDDLILVCDGAV